MAASSDLYIRFGTTYSLYSCRDEALSLLEVVTTFHDESEQF